MRVTTWSQFKMECNALACGGGAQATIKGEINKIRLYYPWKGQA